MYIQGLQTSVSNKAFLTFETLLVWLNEKIPTTAGVKYIFTLPEGNEIREVSQFVGGRSYVVSSVRKIMHVPYGESKERFWRNRCAAPMLCPLYAWFSLLPKDHSVMRYNATQRTALQFCRHAADIW